MHTAKLTDIQAADGSLVLLISSPVTYGTLTPFSIHLAKFRTQKEHLAHGVYPDCDH
jgi:hypothetical protein